MLRSTTAHAPVRNIDSNEEPNGLSARGNGAIYIGNSRVDSGCLGKLYSHGCESWTRTERKGFLDVYSGLLIDQRGQRIYRLVRCAVHEQAIAALCQPACQHLIVEILPADLP